MLRQSACLGFAALLVVIGLAFANVAAWADTERGLRNYLAIIDGRKTLEQFSSDEQLEVLDIHRRLQGLNTGATSGRPSYVIEFAHNDELFIINGEKYEAKTYCLGWDEGDKVIFLEGSAFGVCVSAKLYNLNRSDECRVWCE